MPASNPKDRQERRVYEYTKTKTWTTDVHITSRVGVPDLYPGSWFLFSYTDEGVRIFRQSYRHPFFSDILRLPVPAIVHIYPPKSRQIFSYRHEHFEPAVVHVPICGADNQYFIKGQNNYFYNMYFL